MRPGRWTLTGRGQGEFPVPVANAAGNNLPGITGAIDRPYRPGPGPYSGGQLGGIGDPLNGVDPRADHMQPYPQSSWTDSWSEGQLRNPPGPGLPPFPYGGVGSYQGRGLAGFSGQTGRYFDDPVSGVPDQQQSFRRNGFIGFNDKLTVKDRHAYWDTGNQKTGTGFADGWAGALPNTGNDPRLQPPRPDLRTVNRTVSYQKGTDTTRNQDDLTRAYTWLGEQGSGWIQVNGGVPGLYQPYGTRGGIPYPIVSPVEQGSPGDGRKLVWSGPPHGLHSTTPWKGGAQIIARFMSTPQTRPVRVDRPSNSPQAGQSYSQTVLPQGASRVRPRGGRPGQAGTASAAGLSWPGGRAWGGRIHRGGTGSV